jgi:hypothetical protein
MVSLDEVTSGMSLPSPKTVLRLMLNFCLVGMGICAIANASRVGGGHGRVAWVHDLTIFLFFGLVAFALFFFEYQLVQGITKLDLNLALGYVQSFGCMLLLLCGMWGVYYNGGKGSWQTSNSEFPDNMLLSIYVLGHVLFVTNLVWSYFRQAHAR